MAKILIVGCGDIGTTLAYKLSNEGHRVTALKRHPPAGGGSIDYYPADIGKTSDLAGLSDDFEHLFFIVSADRRLESSYRNVYETGLNNLLAKFSELPWIFVSSTSVYGQSKGEWVDEESFAQPENLSAKLIRQAEQTLIDVNPANIVVRFSGIYGPGRDYLLRMAAQTPAIQKTPPYYTNRIHRQDCVGVLAFLLEKKRQGAALEQCYLASDDEPAPQWEVMSWLAKRLNCRPPTVKTAGADADMNKRCSNRRIKALGYRFLYPGYKEGYGEMIG
ncbi:MAG: SDR family oxidoreductase [Gammaproteobacteria bacterium]